jgi:hypothetical protein
MMNVDNPAVNLTIKTPLSHVHDEFERDLFSLDARDLPCLNSLER